MYLLTGATGYVGGRLLRRLERDGLAVRCLCRNPEALRWRVAPGTEVVQGDLLQAASLGAAFSGVVKYRPCQSVATLSRPKQPFERRSVRQLGAACTSP
jgi:uncharacterized protein YbjT (DUF2867 family)